MSLDMAREFAELTREKRDAEARVAKAKKRLAELDEPLREFMAQEGTPSLKITAPEFDPAKAAEKALLDHTSVDSADLAEIVDILNAQGLLVAAKPEKTATLFIGSRIWASPVIDDPDRDKASDAEYERACDALIANDFGEYAQRRFNVVSLSSAVKELVENGQIPLGEDSTGVAFDGTVKVTEKFAIQARMS